MKVPPKDEKKMTKTQAAAYLGVSTRKLAKLVEEGILEAVPDVLDRRRHLISVTSLDELRRQSSGK